MLLQKSGTVNANCPRRWSLLAGGGLLALGIVLGGLQFSTRQVAAEPTKDADPAKKEAVSEDDIRKALDDLKKGPAPKKADKPADLNPIDEAKKAEEALKKAQEEMRKNPGSEDARKAFEAAIKKYQETMRNRQPNRFPNFPQVQPGAFPQLPVLPEFPPIDPNIFPPFPQIQPLIPGEAGKEMEQLQKMMEELQKQLQMQLQGQPGVFPGRLGGLRTVNRRPSDSRLGVRVEKPTPTLAEQLDLPANKGMVVMEVVPDSTGAKAGIKTNDIIMEIGGKAVSSELGDLQRMMRDFKADEKVDIVLIRKGKKETLKEVALPEAKPEQPNPLNPRFQFPNVPINPRLPNGIPPQFFNNGNGANTAMSVQVVNGEYTIKYQEDGVKLDIKGAKDDGGFQPSSIEIDDNGKITKATSLDKVDEAHRPLVEKVLKRIR